MGDLRFVQVSSVSSVRPPVARTESRVEASIHLLWVQSQLEEEQFSSLISISARWVWAEPAQATRTWQAGVLLYFEVVEQSYQEFEAIGKCLQLSLWGLFSFYNPWHIHENPQVCCRSFILGTTCMEFSKLLLYCEGPKSQQTEHAILTGCQELLRTRRRWLCLH